MKEIKEFTIRGTVETVSHNRKCTELSVATPTVKAGGALSYIKYRLRTENPEHGIKSGDRMEVTASLITTTTRRKGETRTSSELIAKDYRNI